MKSLPILCLCCSIAMTAPVAAYSAFADENPFVEAMLRMMEIFGLIDRDRLPLGVPYLSDYSRYMTPGLGGLGAYPGLGGLSGFSGYPGVGGLPGGVPGMSPMAGLNGMPMAGGAPWAQGWPGGALPVPGAPPINRPWTGQGYPTQTRAPLDGVWELNNGGFVVIRGDRARLYLSRDRYQDFHIGYDRERLWWQPQAGSSGSRYRYQERDGRMIMRDEEGNALLLRRRR